eukprot:TRINITY_DN66418_c8_g3_i1.p3 TRINITY_DN66418_c8_g3~~TRINITY_DN66418_c8_g3_i1.p3  ORF type:complete len:128 (+),score=57.91 TRINITY_DN66418_c8_g3_i1:121-504(+)
MASQVGRRARYIAETRKLWVGKLGKTITRQTLKRYFEKFGPVSSSVVMHDSRTGRPVRYGFVTFDKIEDTAQALAARKTVIHGSKVLVRPVKPKKAKIPREPKKDDTYGFKGFAAGQQQQQQQEQSD